MRLLHLLVFYEGVFNSVVNGAFIRDADIRHLRLAYSMATYSSPVYRPCHFSGIVLVLVISICLPSLPLYISAMRDSVPTSYGDNTSTYCTSVTLEVK